MSKVSKVREYLYNFTDGGWNSEYAISKAQAYKQAVERWGKDSNLAARIDKNSFRVSTPGDYNNLMSLFY